MKRIAILAALAAFTVAVGGTAAASTASTPKLTASVSDPFNISLKKGTTKVTKLKAGTYLITVKDTAADHNFHLTGPGVNKKTSISGKSTTTWKVVLKKGTYKYVCDPHSSFMKGSFTVS
jgi:plastocyanin